MQSLLKTPLASKLACHSRRREEKKKDQSAVMVLGTLPGGLCDLLEAEKVLKSAKEWGVDDVGEGGMCRS